MSAQTENDALLSVNMMNGLKRFFTFWKRNSPSKSPAKKTMESIKDALNSKPSRPMDPTNLGQDVPALKSLCGFLNSDPDVTGLTKAPVDKTGATMAVQDPLTALLPAPNPVVTQPAAGPPKDDLNRIFFTGRLCVGKDHMASAIGATIFGFSEPLYKIAEYFFGVSVNSQANKDIPGMRAFLQAVGQWGRAVISKEYPLTPARALFTETIRTLGPTVIDPEDALKVDWSSYGRNENIWIDAALARIEASPSSRLALTNVRFMNEFKRLQADGWTHFHVMCSSKTWSERLAKRDLKTDAPVLKDLSEKLAAALDQSVIKQISMQKLGHKLHVIWNDATPPPSPRLWTVAEFLQACAVAQPVSAPEDVYLNE